MAHQVPTEVLSDHFQERLAGKHLLGALFLTFEFDPGFFEQQVLPVILDTPVSHAEVARLLQLEGALRDVPFGVAVFYDWTGLRTSDYKAPRLDVQRIPVRLGTGIFHPKNVLLLTEDADPDENGVKHKRLLVATMSANLTRSGWWENVEVCHIEELAQGESTRLKEPLQSLLQRVARLSANDASLAVIAPYQAFLRTLEQRLTRSSDGRLWPHFYVKGAGDDDSVVDFLRSVIPRDDGYRMEVISPFFDKAPSASPLAKLIAAFKPVEVRVFLPQDLTGTAQCSEDLYEFVRGLGDEVSWSVVPDEILALGRGSDAGLRSVHAKVYRIFKPHPKTEYLFVGSPNLTSPGHSGRGGNLETGILVHVDPPSRPDFWLRATKRKPTNFAAVAPEDEEPSDAPLPVQLRYSWRTHTASGRWDGQTPSVQLTLLGSGGPFAGPLQWPARVWQPLSDEAANALGAELKSTSIIAVRTLEGRESAVLVQEEEMTLKPELLRRLPVRDILQYWSLLKPEQRQAFLDSRADQLTPGELGQAMVRLGDDGARVSNDIFERCAGVFHAFGQLEARVFDALQDGHDGHAAALVFGERFDSLGTVLDRVLRGDVGDEHVEQMSDVDRYLVLMCAKQLCDAVKTRAAEFWRGYEAQAGALDERVNQRATLRDALCASDLENMPAFMDWFDTWFLRRAQPVGRR